MRVSRDEIPLRIDAPGAKARQLKNFGDATGYGKISGEYFSLRAGTDMAPLLQGLDGDLCQSPHWGYVIKGRLIVSFEDGHRELVQGRDMFYWPPGHTVMADRDTEMVLFSPQQEHSEVLEHILSRLKQ